MNSTREDSSFVFFTVCFLETSVYLIRQETKGGELNLILLKEKKKKKEEQQPNAYIKQPQTKEKTCKTSKNTSLTK
jgi:hypothetical protein